MGTQIRTEEIYEALFDDDAFARLPNILARAANARSGLMLWQYNDGTFESVSHSYFAPEWISNYASYAEVDPYRRLALRADNLNRVILPNDVVSRDQFENSLIYNELIRRLGDDTVYCSGCGISSAWGSGIIGVHRGRRNRPFDENDASRLGSVAVHAERVLRARGEIASARRTKAFAQGALDTIGLVAITVRANGHIVHSNEAADGVLRKADGMVVKNGLLSANTMDAKKQLAAAIAGATAKIDPVATAVVVGRGPDEVAYLVAVTPLVGRIGTGAALVLFRDPTAQDGSLTGRLRTLFNLTNAEAAIALNLANGLQLGDIARNRGVRLSTIRAQLKSMGAKTGCSRRSEMTALFHRLPPIS